MSIQQEFHKEYTPEISNPIPENNTNKLQEYVDRVQSEDISSIYPQASDAPDRLNFTDKRSDGNEQTLQLNKSEM